jgi:hypothetical protein
MECGINFNGFNLGLGLIMWYSFSSNERVKKKKKLMFVVAYVDDNTNNH